MTNRLKVLAVVFAVVGVLLCALLVAGMLLSDYYILRPWLHHPLIFGVGGFGVLAVAWGLGIAHPVIKPIGMVVFGMAAAAAAGLVWLVSMLDSELHELSRHPAPDGSMEVVVYSGLPLLSIDPYDQLRVYTKRGPLSREMTLGCVDPERYRLTEIEWVGGRTVRAHLGRDQIVDVTFSEGGQPDHVIKAGC